MGNATVGGESATACSMYTDLPITHRDKTKCSKKKKNQNALRGNNATSILYELGFA